MARKIIGIIPAKGHSRRVPGKNMRLFNGKPLLFYTIQRAMESRLLNEVVVTTDSAEIAQYCAGLGIPAPFPRRPEHSGDEVHAVVPILDMLERLGGVAAYSHCVPLIPTYPLRRPGTIDAVVRRSMDTGRNVLSVAPLGKVIHHLRWLDPGGALRPVTEGVVYNFQTQDAPELLSLTGVAYCAPVEELVAQRTFQYGQPLGHVIDKIEATDVDTEDDFRIAEQLFGLLDPSAEAPSPASCKHRS